MKIIRFNFFFLINFKIELVNISFYQEEIVDVVVLNNSSFVFFLTQK
jgi:hypothetical protein